MNRPLSDNAGEFKVVETQPLALERKSPLKQMYTLSPFVWRQNGRYELLLRAVNRSAIAARKVARVYYGHSGDGLRFSMDDRPVLAPGPDDEDRDGCEDPTLAIVDETYYVYYTGWNQTLKRGALLLATGSDVQCLEKQGVALSSSEGRENPKEATIVPVADGSWRLFFEYAAAGASKIGIAAADTVRGPWRVLDSFVHARADRWDSWHLSTGPVLTTNPQRPIMFYNGATKAAKWRIGWMAFDERYTRVVERCEEPLLQPTGARRTEDTDIAFAASAIERDGTVYLYYSVADRKMLRATIVRSP